MSNAEIPEGFGFMLAAGGSSLLEPRVMVLPVSGDDVLEVAPAEYSTTLRAFTFQEDPVHVDELVRKRTAAILKIALTRFFSQATGLSVVEVYEFDAATCACGPLRYEIREVEGNLVIIGLASVEAAMGSVLGAEDRTRAEETARAATVHSSAKKPKR